MSATRLANIAAQAYTWQGTDVTFISHVQGKDPNNNLIDLAQANFSAIAYEVYDQSTGSLVNSGTLTISTVVFNTLQTGTIWTADTAGFNFLATLPATPNFPLGTKVYVVSFIFTLTPSGNVFDVVFENITRSRATAN